MNSRKAGFLVILIGLAFIAVLFAYKIQVDRLTDSLMEQSGGNCVADGECIHEQSNIPFTAGIAAIVFTFGFGIYLLLFSKTARSFEAAQKNILKKISSTKNKELKEERFSILLEGLDEGEKKALTKVKEQDGISQTTLMYRTDMSKSKLSMVLSQLERKNLITKVKKGKINNIFLKKAL